MTSCTSDSASWSWIEIEAKVRDLTRLLQLSPKNIRLQALDLLEQCLVSIRNQPESIEIFDKEKYHVLIEENVNIPSEGAQYLCPAALESAEESKQFVSIDIKHRNEEVQQKISGDSKILTRQGRPANLDACDVEFDRKTNAAQYLKSKQEVIEKSADGAGCSVTITTKKTRCSRSKAERKSVNEDADGRQKVIGSLTDSKLLMTQSPTQPINTRRDRTPFNCELCDAVLSSKGTYVEHIARHFNYRRKMCDTCGKTFPNASQLAAHRTTHRQSTVQCDQCKKTLRNKHKLRVHMYTHTGVKDFSCPLCSYQSYVKHNLKKHCRVQHQVEYPAPGERSRRVQRLTLQEVSRDLSALNPVTQRCIDMISRVTDTPATGREW